MLARLKRVILFFAAITATIVVLCLSPLFAQTTTSTTTTDPNAPIPGTTDTPSIGGTGGSTSEEYLYYIMQNTWGILLMVNNLPVYMTNLTNMALSWLAPDDSTTTASMQSNFANLGNAFLQENSTKQSLQPRILTSLFPDVTQEAMPYANDLAYQTLLGMPLFDPDPRNPAGKRPPPVDPAYNYILNASGASNPHVPPGNNFAGYPADQKRYSAFYNTVMAAGSFNAYVLSEQYADSVDGGLFTTLQNTLISQASGSDWFAQVATEKIGIVLRQILMYQSQSFVILTQILQTQKSLLTAQAINNSLVILNAGNVEDQLRRKAISKQP